MPLDWSKLSPHRPLKPNDPLHVRRPEGGGEELAAWVKAGVETVAIAGPVGGGKSTELSWAASCLQKTFVVVQVPLDRLLDMRRVMEEDVFLQIAGRVAEVARKNLHLQLSDTVERQLAQPSPIPRAPGNLGSSDRDLLLHTLREAAQNSPQGALALLLDGLEKCDPESALRIVRALLAIRNEARVIFVAPFSIVVGSGAHELVTSIDRFLVVRAVPVRKDQGVRSEKGRAFLKEIVRVRLDCATLPEDLAAILDRAAEASGGVPRTFLQLVRAAASYAVLAERGDAITHEDLNAAMLDHAESLSRLLVEGDIEHLRAANGTAGIEVPEERRLRLLMHGLLLEYRMEQGNVVHPAPLLHDVLEGGAAR